MDSMGGDDPSPEGPSPDDLEWMRRRNAPDNEIPVPLPWSAVLARSDELAVALVGAWAYRNGLALAVTVRSRRSTGHGLGAALHGHPGIYELDPGADGPSGQQPRDQLLLGVEYADGRHASNIPPEQTSGEPARPGLVGENLGPDEPLLMSVRGGGGGRRYAAEFFLSPLPPTGGLSVYCAWPGQGLPETRTVFDTDEPLQAAVESVEVLWPDEPEPSATIYFTF